MEDRLLYRKAGKEQYHVAGKGMYHADDEVQYHAENALYHAVWCHEE